MDFVEIEVLKTEGKNGDFLDALVRAQLEDREFIAEKMISTSIDDYFQYNEQPCLLSLSDNYIPRSLLELPNKQNEVPVFEFMKEETCNYSGGNDIDSDFEDFMAFDEPSLSPSPQVLEIKEGNKFDEILNENSNNEQIKIEVMDEETIIEEICPSDLIPCVINKSKNNTIKARQFQQDETVEFNRNTLFRNKVGRPKKNEKTSIKNLRLYYDTDGTKLLTCPKCDYQTENVKNLRVHLITHTKERPFKCSVCKYSCKQKHSLTIHMLKHSTLRPYSCQICEYRSKSKQGLKIHCRKHTGEKPYGCPNCSFRASTSGRLHVHMYTHTKDKPYKCKLCHFQALNLSRLESHMLRHNRPRPYECPECEEGFTTKRMLKGHMFIHSSNKQSYECDLCPRVYCRAADLKKHKESHEPNYLKCPTCDYIAKTENKLNVHCLKHSDSKRYCCSICDYSSSSTSLLELHMSIHEFIRPLVCPLCGFTSMKPNSLGAHLSCHFTENPHCCPHCSFMCTNRGNYNRHIAKH